MIYEIDTNLDGPEAGTVAGGHVLVERLDGGSARELTELLVHVVRARARVVADPDTEVLDLQGLLLVDLQKENTQTHTEKSITEVEVVEGRERKGIWSEPKRLPLEWLQGYTQH